MYTHRLGPRDHILRTTLPKPDDSSQALPLASRQTAILACCPDLHATRPLIHRACSIIASVTTGFRLSFYDALYVALAEREGCDLISGDGKLVRNLQTSYPFIKSLASLP